MVKFEIFIYRKADKILEEKELYSEIKSILSMISKIDHAMIKEKFQDNGWLIESDFFYSSFLAWDAYKDNIAVSIELDQINAVYKDFLKAILAHKQGRLNVLVYIVSTFRQPRFHSIKRDIEMFKEILTLPILLIGLT